MLVRVRVTSLFADDTRVLREVKDEEDVEKLQADLDILYEWQKKNNMEFNGKKFEVMRYGSNNNIKESTVYFTLNFDEVIEENVLICSQSNPLWVVNFQRLLADGTHHFVIGVLLS